MSASAFNNYETLARTMGITDLMRLPAILNCRITDLLPDSVVTDYDRERAADPKLREVQERWNNLPEYVQESIVLLARGAEEDAQQ